MKALIGRFGSAAQVYNSMKRFIELFHSDFTASALTGS
jgi:hypothetical protein